MDTPRRSTPQGWASGQPPQGQSAQSEQSLRPLKRRRSHAALTNCCRTCRLRKVKCSGNIGDGKACSNCMRLELVCSFNDDENNTEETPSEGVVSRTTPSRSHTEAGTLRKRAQRACTECHSHKTRCSGDYPRCKRCEASNLVCEYAPAKRKLQHVPAGPENKADAGGSPGSRSVAEAPSPENGDTSQSSSLGTSLPDPANLVNENVLANKDLVLKHIDAYFEYLYFTPCLGFLHKETIYEELEDGRLHAAFAAGICSVSAFFVSPGPKAIDFASRCSTQVDFHVFQTIGGLRELNLYLYVFGTLHNHISGNYAKCWQLLAAAARLMVGLQLNWGVPGSNRLFKEQECARRLAWQIFHLDRLFAGGFDAYICCREDIMKIRLPCPEDAFDADKEVFVETLVGNPEEARSPPGPNGYQIRLVNIRHHIRTAAMKFASGSPQAQRAMWEPSKVMEDIRKLQLELSMFSSSLPTNMKLSDQNIVRWLHSPERQVFVLLHGLYCTSHIDLYRFSLPGIRERGSPNLLRKLPTEFILKSQKQAIAHAITLARFWETVYNEIETISDGREILLGDYTIAESIQQCIRVLITVRQYELYRDLSSHSTAPLWRSEPVDKGSIRPLIDACLRVLEPWSQIIPSVKPQFDELLARVKEFDRTSRFGEDAHLELTEEATSRQIKLPGAHHLLEHAYMGQKEENETPMRPAMIERYYSAPMRPDYLHDPYTGPEASDHGWESEVCPPGMPILLARARGLPLEQPPKNSQPTTSTGAATGPEDLGSGVVQSGYTRRAETPPSGQAGGLPIMTVGQLHGAQRVGPRLQGGYRQASYSGQQNEPSPENFRAPFHDAAQERANALS